MPWALLRRPVCCFQPCLGSILLGSGVHAWCKELGCSDARGVEAASPLPHWHAYRTQLHSLMSSFKKQGSSMGSMLQVLEDGQSAFTAGQESSTLAPMEEVSLISQSQVPPRDPQQAFGPPRPKPGCTRHWLAQRLAALLPRSTV